MKIKTLVLVLSFFISNGQSDYDTDIENLAKEVGIRISESDMKKIAVSDFVNTDGEITKLGKFIAEDFSVYFTNEGESKFKVMDRNHLNQILKEHKLNSEGFIDTKTAKELGRLVAVDAIITGTVDILGDNIKVRIKVLDTETALQIAAEIAYLTIDENIASFLGVPNYDKNKRTKKDNSDIPKSPSVEKYDYNNDSNTDCEKKNTGSYCFKNNSKVKIAIKLVEQGTNIRRVRYAGRDFIINPGDTECYYQKTAKPYKYFIFKSMRSAGGTGDVWNIFIKSGNMEIEKCRSKTLELNNLK